MKRLVFASLILALMALCIGAQDASAAGVRIRTVGRAPNDYAGTTGVNNGLAVIGKGAKAFAMADTAGSGAAGPAAWTLLQRPAGSASVLDSANKMITSFSADTTGFYILSLTYGTAATVFDTIYASTYLGITQELFSATVPNGCNGCHQPGSTQDKALQDWKNTGHAQIFKQGISGMLEVEANPLDGKMYGAYTKTCARCHTVGYDVAKNNGNFAYLAHNLPAPAPASWDSTWWKSVAFMAGSTDFAVPYDTGFAIWKAMPAQLQGLGTIGCENCHGPLAGHFAQITGGFNFRQTVDVSLSPDVCNQCHNASATSHNVGGYYNLSGHALVPSEQRTSCAPCHQGAGMVKFMESGKNPSSYAALTADELATPISCVVCHDPHKASTLKADGTMDPGLRQISVDSLRNGYQLKPAGTSQVCEYCHSSRYSVTAKVKPASAPYYGFGDRFGPHENPQFDMLVGSNGYQFGDASFTGLNTHMGLENGCVTCHMQPRMRNGKGTAHTNHGMSMTDTTWGFNGAKICGDCHGEVADYNDVKAFYDYDRNGKIEGVQTEIQGMLSQLKAALPQDASGNPVTMMADSLKVKNHPEIVEKIWNYYFVLNDGSMGIHNTKYAVRLLYKSLGWIPTFVKDVKGPVPTTYALEQNYPNPFNPSTKIRFALPKEEHVKLEIFDVTGALVKTLLNEAVRAGNMEVTWDGTNTNGARVTSGMYFYRLVAGSSFVTSKKMLLLK